MWSTTPNHFDFRPRDDMLKRYAPQICTSRPGYDRTAFHQAFNREVVTFCQTRPEKIGSARIKDHLGAAEGGHEFAGRLRLYLGVQIWVVRPPCRSGGGCTSPSRTVPDEFDFTSTVVKPSAPSGQTVETP